MNWSKVSAELNRQIKKFSPPSICWDVVLLTSVKGKIIQWLQLHRSESFFLLYPLFTSSVPSLTYPLLYSICLTHPYLTLILRTLFLPQSYYITSLLHYSTFIPPPPQFIPQNQVKIDFDDMDKYSESFDNKDVAFCALGTTRAKSGIVGTTSYTLKTRFWFLISSASDLLSYDCIESAYLIFVKLNKTPLITVYLIPYI